MEKVGKEQEDMGEALVLDGIINSIDAEVIATGPSDKGPNRGAIVRHGAYVLWSFEGPVANMTEEGRKLFINTVFYTAKQSGKRILEKKINGTRDGLFTYIKLAKDVNPGFLKTLGQYLPESVREKNLADTEEWLKKNRPYLRADGRVYYVDELARSYNIPNHKIAYLEKCISSLKEEKDVSEIVTALERYTGVTDFGISVSAWEKWYVENKDYIFFSDSDGFRWIIDEGAKTAGIPVKAFRNWSGKL